MVEAGRTRQFLPRRRHQSGVALVLVLLVLAALTMSAVGLTVSVQGGLKGAGRDYLWVACLDIADAQNSAMLGQLRSTAQSFSAQGRFFPETAQSLGAGTVTLGKLPFTWSATARGRDASLAKSLSEQQIDLTSSCTAPDSTVHVDVRTTGHLGRGTLWPDAVCGCSSVTFQGNAGTDSYHSPSGPYEKQTPGDDGNIASDGSITLKGRAEIRGSVAAYTSIAATATTKVTGGSVSGGSNAIGGGQSNVSPRPTPCHDTCGMYDVEAAVASASKVNDDGELGDCRPYVTGTALALKGTSSCTLPPGTYYFTDLSLKGNASLSVSGPTTIYVHGGAVDLGGHGTVNGSEHATWLRIITDTKDVVTYLGSSAFSGFLYAPNTTITYAGTSDVYGALVGDNVIFKGSSMVHYDTAATSFGYIPSGNFALSAWSAG